MNTTHRQRSAPSTASPTPTTASTSRPRRELNTTHRQPQIDVDLRRVLAACRAAGDVLAESIGFDAHTASQAATRGCKELETASDNVQVALDAIQTAAATALAHALASRQAEQLAAARSAATLIHDGALARRMRAAAQAVDGQRYNVEDVVAGEVQQGLDADELCWALVRAESLHHVNLIWHELNKHAGALDEGVESVLCYGWLGLRFALRGFDPTKGVRFSTFACYKINGAVADGLRSENRLPKRLTTVARSAKAAEERLANSLGRSPSISEIAAELQLNEAHAALLPRIQSERYLDDMLRNFDRPESCVPAVLIDPAATPSELAINAVLAQEVQEALSELPPAQAAAIKCQMMGMTIPEAKDATGMTARKLLAHQRAAMATLEVSLSRWAHEVPA